jgi:hypothetical protein
MEREFDTREYRHSARDIGAFVAGYGSQTVIRGHGRLGSQASCFFLSCYWNIPCVVGITP